jgi:2-oxo-4-hydroxy-4-carboxy-5-ureidoimidazoline decarboxylase
MKIDDIDSLAAEDFVAKLGGIYEHSPWAAERVEGGRPFGSRDALALAMSEEVEGASEAEKLALLRAHPDLGTRAKISQTSAGEQAGAGLDRLTTEEYDRLTALNTRYREKFGFPFLYAVKGSGKSAILEALAIRLENGRDAEFSEAIHQVHRIAGFRLRDLIEEP